MYTLADNNDNVENHKFIYCSEQERLLKFCKM